MKKKLTVSLAVLVIICVVLVINLIAKINGKSGVIQIPLEERIKAPLFSPASVVSNFCEIINDDGTPDGAEANFDSGMGYAVYMDPAQCAPYPYPFMITDAHFYLYDVLKADFLWPVNIRINILDVSGDSICHGPGTVLFSQAYTVPHDSAYPKMINMSISPPCCVTGPFFLEVMYESKKDTFILPGLLYDAEIATPDTCVNWYDSLGVYQTWTYYWGDPPKGDVILRATGYFGSTECESLWYWKPDTTHAPSGMPDFDQYQFGPTDSQAFCGPTAVANCLWWYNAVPDSLKNNPASFIRLLAGYCHTDKDSGTFVDSITAGLNRYFRLSKINLYAQTYSQPYFKEMEDSLKKCQDVILLLGFYQGPDKRPWTRFGGHYVTMAGVCSESLKIAISDPAWDAAESGFPGRVRPPDHPLHPGNHKAHNDTLLVCHDIYQSDTISLSPGNPHWWLPTYVGLDSFQWFAGKNFQPGQYSIRGPYIPGSRVNAEVEYAIMICPKAVEDSCWYYKPDTTTAPSGMPDFDQYQFVSDSQAFCGPTAVANCLWWFDAVPQAYKDDPLGFIRLLAGYFHTDKDSGTYVDSIQQGLNRYFLDYHFALKETTYFKPYFTVMEDSLKKCQDIILLLGFWQSKGGWYRVGGHYVTMSGVCSSTPWVALSDPARNTAESGWPGRVRPDVHPVHPMGDTLHNDPQYVSHDAYMVLPSPGPGDTWQLSDYAVYQSITGFTKQNFQPLQKPLFDYYDSTLAVFAEVEYAIMICRKPPSSVEEEGSVTPKYFELFQNHPNPFNSETVIRFNLLRSSDVTLVIYNTLGQKVKTLVQGHLKAGITSVSWDGKDEKGNTVSSGVYLYELKAGSLTETKRMVLLK